MSDRINDLNDNEKKKSKINSQRLNEGDKTQLDSDKKVKYSKHDLDSEDNENRNNIFETLYNINEQMCSKKSEIKAIIKKEMSNYDVKKDIIIWDIKDITNPLHELSEYYRNISKILIDNGTVREEKQITYSLLKKNGFGGFIKKMQSFSISPNEIRHYLDLELQNAKKNSYKNIFFDEYGRNRNKDSIVIHAADFLDKYIYPEAIKRGIISNGDNLYYKNIQQLGFGGWLSELKNYIITLNDVKQKSKTCFVEFELNKYTNIYKDQSGKVRKKEEAILIANQYFEQKILPDLYKDNLLNFEDTPSSALIETHFRGFIHALQVCKITWNDFLNTTKDFHSRNDWTNIYLDKNGDLLSSTEILINMIDCLEEQIYPDLVERNLLGKDENPKLELVIEHYSGFISSLTRCNKLLKSEEKISWNKILNASEKFRINNETNKWTPLFKDSEGNALSKESIINNFQNYYKKIIIPDLNNKGIELNEKSSIFKILYNNGHSNFIHAIQNTSRVDFKDIFASMGYKSISMPEKPRISSYIHNILEDNLSAYFASNNITCMKEYHISPSAKVDLFISLENNTIPFFSNYMKAFPNTKNIIVEFIISSDNYHILEHLNRGYQNSENLLVLINPLSKFPILFPDEISEKEMITSTTLDHFLKQIQYPKEEIFKIFEILSLAKRAFHDEDDFLKLRTISKNKVWNS